MEQEQVAALIEEHLKTIYAYALSRVSHKEDAEDLAGDIVLAILQSAPKIRDDNAFFGYIWAIAANTYKKYLRKQRAVTYVEPDENIVSDEPDLMEKMCRAEELNQLRRELAMLSREHRECTVSYYIEGASCSETAKRLGISLDMVKYYLFKTRKILKEGIGMERLFGEKSYKPSEFEFVTIFSGKFNREYRNLFNRKLPGNILVSAYYTPMTVRELAIELGVAAVYLEDEIELLLKYGVLLALPQGKYQTNLVIFTESYQNELIKTVERDHMDKLAAILRSIKQKLPRIREIGFYGAEFEDNHLLWPLLVKLMRDSIDVFRNTHPKSKQKREIYEGATGTNYGIDHHQDYGEYGCRGFAGCTGDSFFAAFANFNILPEQNHCDLKGDLSGVPRFTVKQKEMLDEILSEEIASVADFYHVLSRCAVGIMKEHAPRSIEGMIEEVIEQTLFFRTVGIVGALAVHSGEMTVPEHPKVKPMYIYDLPSER